MNGTHVDKMLVFQGIGIIVLSDKGAHAAKHVENTQQQTYAYNRYSAFS
jgi:hypothetical protein